MVPTGAGMVFTTSFAADSEVAESGLGQVPHGTSIGEQETKICTGRFGGDWDEAVVAGEG